MEHLRVNILDMLHTKHAHNQGSVRMGLCGKVYVAVWFIHLLDPFQEVKATSAAALLLSQVSHLFHSPLTKRFWQRLVG